MSESSSDESLPAPEEQAEEANSRRTFLKGAGKWSGAAIVAAVAGLSVTGAPKAQAGWLNRRGGWLNRGGGWINRGGGGGWINRRGGGGWINRR